MLTLKGFYKNDVTLLQYCSVFLSMKIINEVYVKGFNKDDLKKIQIILKQILEFNKNIKKESQQFILEKFLAQINQWIKLETNLICLKNFVIEYLENEENALDALLELNYITKIFKEEYTKYQNNRKNENYNFLNDIVENTISNFLNDSVLYQKMHRSYYNKLSEVKIEDPNKIKEENEAVILNLKKVTSEYENKLKENNIILKNKNDQIILLQKNEKDLKKKIKKIEKDNKDNESKFNFIFESLEQIKKKDRENEKII